ncbi:MAG: hypothetical protein L0Y56_16595 [Nitrospira sp.]|nr:hypothetical protein [Nitrospira sp.]
MSEKTRRESNNIFQVEPSTTTGPDGGQLEMPQDVDVYTFDIPSIERIIGEQDGGYVIRLRQLAEAWREKARELAEGNALAVAEYVIGEVVPDVGLYKDPVTDGDTPMPPRVLRVHGEHFSATFDVAHFVHSTMVGLIRTVTAKGVTEDKLDLALRSAKNGGRETATGKSSDGLFSANIQVLANVQDEGKVMDWLCKKIVQATRSALAADAVEASKWCLFLARRTELHPSVFVSLVQARLYGVSSRQANTEALRVSAEILKARQTAQNEAESAERAHLAAIARPKAPEGTLGEVPKVPAIVTPVPTVVTSPPRRPRGTRRPKGGKGASIATFGEVVASHDE